MAYTQYGPFSNGSAPGVAAEFLNPLESFLQTVNSAATDSHITADGNGILTMLGLVNNDAGVTINGTTSGTATLYQFLRGNVKGIFLYLNGYRNSTTTEQKISIPQPFTKYGMYIAPGPLPIMHFFLSGSQVTGKINIINAFPSPPGSGTAISNLDAINGNEYGEITGGFDQIGLGTSTSSNRFTSLFIIGS